MKLRFAKAIALGFGVVMLASVAAAATACSGHLGADVTTLNAGGGCTVSILTFSNFAVGLAGGTGPAEVFLSGVNDPGVGGSGLNFNPNLGLGHLTTDIHFVFEVTANSGLIDIISEYLANNGIGSGGIGERICDSAGVSLGGTCTGTQIATLSALNGQTSSTTFAGQKSLWIWKNITISDPAVDHNSSFDQNFGSTVPEPMTLSMMGIGLLGLGLISRHRKS